MSKSSAPGPDLTALSPWAPELAKTFVSLSSDIALVIDEAGVIRNVAQVGASQGGAEPIAPGVHGWVGRRAWIDTVSGETRPKIEHLLKEVAASGIARRREVNHPAAAGGASIPVAYTAIRLGANGPVLAVGRDLRSIAAIQQRFVESQQDLERGYWQARQAETRYQLLFQVATDAVMVVDAESLLVVEANQAAGQLFDVAPEQLAGRHAGFGFEHHSRGAVIELLSNARGSGQGAEIRARLMGSVASASVAATPFRAGDAMRLLVRVRAIDTHNLPATLNQTLARLVDDARDGVVVTDSTGRVQLANAAFLALAHLPHEGVAKDRPLMTWLGLGDAPLTAIVAKVRRDGIARRMASWVRPANGAARAVEVSAALLTEGDQECIGFTVHALATAAAARDTAAATDALHDAIQALAQRLGAADLAQMLRETAALAEHHFVQLALQRSGGDADAAAALLGVARERVRGADAADASNPTESA